MARRRHQPPQEAAPTSVRSQCLRYRRKGEQRKALLALRTACFQAEEDALLWAMYAAQCQRVGDRDGAAQAYQHAIWLRERQGDGRRAESLRSVVRRMDKEPQFYT